MMNRRFDARLAERLDAPERLTWLPAGEVVAALDVKPAEVIADIGAGTGYFALPLAEATGHRGMVYAVDSQEPMLKILREKLLSRGLGNIETVFAEADATFLSSALCDLVFFANVWHEFPDRSAVLRESRRILKNLGRISILDWSPEVAPEHGPPLNHRLSAQSAIGELQAAGFKQVSHTNVGKYSWLVQAVAGREACGRPASWRGTRTISK